MDISRDLSKSAGAAPPDHESAEIFDLAQASGRRYAVTTASGTVHVFDLDAGTVSRLPRPGHEQPWDGVERALRTIEVCRVDERGRWTLLSADFLIDYYLHVSTRVIRIERVPEKN